MGLFSLQGQQLLVGDAAAHVENPPPSTDGRRFFGMVWRRPALLLVAMTRLFLKTRLGDTGGTVAASNPGGQELGAGAAERSRSQYNIVLIDQSVQRPIVLTLQCGDAFFPHICLHDDLTHRYNTSRGSTTRLAASVSH